MELWPQTYSLSLPLHWSLFSPAHKWVGPTSSYPCQNCVMTLSISSTLNHPSPLQQALHAKRAKSIISKTFLRGFFGCFLGFVLPCLSKCHSNELHRTEASKQVFLYCTFVADAGDMCARRYLPARFKLISCLKPWPSTQRVHILK